MHLAAQGEEQVGFICQILHSLRAEEMNFEWMKADGQKHRQEWPHVFQYLRVRRAEEVG